MDVLGLGIQLCKRAKQLFLGLLDDYSGAAAAYSLRKLSRGYSGPIVRVRRDGDADGATNERDFNSTNQIEDWVNGKLETTLPADVATSSAAYSLRKVKAGYTGDAVRIRRASDDVEVDAAFDANGAVSASSAITNVTESPDQGDTTATTLGGFLTEGGNQDAYVQTWYDQSGNSNDATQNTTDDQPKIAEAGALLADGIDFDGSSSNLDMPSVISSVALASSFVVAKASNVSQTGIALALSRNNPDQRWYAPAFISGTSYFGYGDSASKINLGATDTNEHLFSAIADSSNATAFLDATSKGSTAVFTGTGLLTSGGIGAVNDTSFYEGSIKEIVVYNSDQTSNRFKIESNVNNYYGIYTNATTTDYVSDFSAGVDGWSDNNGFATFTGNQDGIGGRDDVLKVENTAGTARQVRPSNNTAIPHDGTFRLTLDVYRVGGTGVPAYMGAYSGNAGATQNPSLSTEMTEDQSVTLDFGNLTYENYTRFNLFFSASLNSTSVSGVADGGIIYFRNAIVEHVSDGFVENWYDQSGNGNHAEQLTLGNQPKIVSNGNLLADGIDFDGVSDFFTASGVSTTQPYSVFMKIKASETGAVQQIIDSGSVDPAFFQFSTAGVLSINNPTSTVTSLDLTSTPTDVLISGFIDDPKTAFADGASILSPAAGTGTNSLSGLTIGKHRTLSSSYYGGNFSELIIYDSDQSANRSGIESNIADHYGITLP